LVVVAVADMETKVVVAVVAKFYTLKVRYAFQVELFTQ
jgi:hypothetical protein